FAFTQRGWKRGNSAATGNQIERPIEPEIVYIHHRGHGQERASRYDDLEYCGKNTTYQLRRLIDQEGIADDQPMPLEVDNRLGTGPIESEYRPGLGIGIGHQRIRGQIESDADTWRKAGDGDTLSGRVMDAADRHLHVEDQNVANLDAGGDWQRVAERPRHRDRRSAAGNAESNRTSIDRDDASKIE